MRLDVPVDPDADQARQWLERELADPVYRERRSLLQRFWDWLSDLFGSVPTGGQGGPWWLLLVVALVVVVALVAFRVAGPVRRGGSGAGRSARVIDADDRRDAEDLRAAANAAAAAGDWVTAVAERFRALVRALEDRAVLDERPGRTAREATDTVAQRLPAHAEELRWASHLFDGVVYGHHDASPADDERLRELDRVVDRARVSVR
ncbi:DUF4129 domain-containing protein [Cellulomonas sp. NPDC089187]|uniref:DUF4129 domain-containing protein n=1 Tax=Cellulomonas sp. NPDC089187 TaxID=3154970 RepID=UPI00344AE4D8